MANTGPSPRKIDGGKAKDIRSHPCRLTISGNDQRLLCTGVKHRRRWPGRPMPHYDTADFAKRPAGCSSFENQPCLSKVGIKPGGKSGGDTGAARGAGGHEVE